MQNINILLFVRLLSLTNWRYAWSDVRQDIIDTALTSAESVSRHVSVQMVDIWTLFVNKLLQTISIFDFSCVFGASGLCPSCQIFTVLMLDGR